MLRAMTSWDRRTPKQLATRRAAAVRAQVGDVIGPFSPYWRERLAGLGRTPVEAGTLAGVAALPAAGERDVCPDGDPAGAGALVLQVGERGFALHAEGPTLRRALRARLVSKGSYRALVEADTRPTSYVWAGLGLRFPVASTRGDLDVIARAGARLWQVLGLTRADVLVAALPLLPTAALQGLQYAALGAGSPALFPGAGAEQVAGALALVPATVLALLARNAAVLLDDLGEAGAQLSAVRTVLLVGAPSDDERAEVAEALARVQVSDVAVLAVHVPDGHRLLWGECRQSAGAGVGLHTYPDLELLALIDPETGEPPAAGPDAGGGPYELVLTQLGLRGSALLRWRTGDLAEAIEEQRCPACSRTVPRVVGTRRGALVPSLALRTGPRAVDLRAVSGALVGRPDVEDWRVLIGTSARDGADELLVHVVPRGRADRSAVAVAVARDRRATAGLLPTQVLVSGAGQLPPGAGRLSRRVLSRGMER